MEAEVLQGSAKIIRLSGYKNPDGKRTPLDALALAKREGIVFDGYQVRLEEDASIKEYAIYLQNMRYIPGVTRGVLKENVLYLPGNDELPTVRVRMHPNILESDPDIINILAHESYELNELTTWFMHGGGQIPLSKIFELLGGPNGGTLHESAVDYGNQKMEDYMRRRGIR